MVSLHDYLVNTIDNQESTTFHIKQNKIIEEAFIELEKSILNNDTVEQIQEVDVVDADVVDPYENNNINLIIQEGYDDAIEDTSS